MKIRIANCTYLVIGWLRTGAIAPDLFIGCIEDRCSAAELHRYHCVSHWIYSDSVASGWGGGTLREEDLGTIALQSLKKKYQINLPRGAF
jgi:hypothetical protein